MFERARNFYLSIESATQKAALTLIVLRATSGFEIRDKLSTGAVGFIVGNLEGCTKRNGFIGIYEESLDQTCYCVDSKWLQRVLRLEVGDYEKAVENFREAVLSLDNKG